MQALASNILILRCSEKAAWPSVLKSENNYLKSYRLLKYKQRVFETPPNLNSIALRKVGLLSKLVTHSKKIIFLDQNLDLEKLIPLVCGFCDPNATMYFHIYGDFIQRLKLWYKVSPFLQDKKIVFIAASTAHCSLVKGVWGPYANIKRAPFPIDDSFFSAPIKQNHSHRLLYLGRYSKEKNYQDLIVSFDKAKITSPESIHLLCHGYFGQEALSLHRGRQKFRRPESGRIKIKGPVQSKELMKTIQSASWLVSASTFVQEEYGLAILQGLALGKPVLITKWGGHHDFLKFPLAKSIKLHFEGRYKPDHLRETLEKTNWKIPSLKEAKKQRSKVAQEFSIRAVSRTLERVLKSPAIRFRASTSLTKWGRASLTRDNINKLVYHYYKPRMINVDF